jgi:LacI family transcriptional regulator
LGPDIRDRYLGFAQAHESGLGEAAAEPLSIPFREADGTRVAERLLAGEVRADALVCANDELALSIMARLQEGGRDVPGDIAVVGWDDVMTARYVRPGLTTVRQPVRELGAMAADRLHELVTGASPHDGLQVLSTQLVLRASCGCPPAATGFPTAPSSGDPHTV